MIRSSDFPENETEFDRATDDMAQTDVEDGCDWRAAVSGWRKIDWRQIMRGEAVPAWARVAA